MENSMSTLTGLISSGGGGGAIEEAAEAQVLEANKEYWVKESITEISLPDASSLGAGAFVKLYPSSGGGFGYILNSSGKNIFYNNLLRGPATATHPRTSTAVVHTDPITYYWTGFAWVTLPINATMNTLTDNSGSPIIYTSSDTFVTPSANNLVVTVVGGGGGSYGQNWHGGAGGGGGGTIHKHPMTLPVGTEVTVTVGSGGSNGWTTAGGTGGTSSFGGYLLAYGGGGSTSRTGVGIGGSYGGSETITRGVNGGNGGTGETVSHSPISYGNNYTNGESVTDPDGVVIAGGSAGGRGSSGGYPWGAGGGGGAAAYPGYGQGGLGRSWSSQGWGTGQSGIVVVEFS